MTQNPSPDVVRPSMYTKKSRPLRHRFVRCWWWWEWRLEYTEYKHQYKPAYNSYRFHSFPLLPCLNWGHSSKACRSFHQRAFDAATAPSWYADLLGIWRWGSLKAVLALKGAVKFRTFLCLHRIRGFRPPKSMETSWKWSKCSNRRCSSGNRQPTGCIPWQRTPRVFCGKWLNLEVGVGFAVPSPGNPKSHYFWSLWLNRVKDSFLGSLIKKSLQGIEKMVKPNQSCTFRMTQKISRIWPYTGKYGHIWPWFRSQSHSKAIVFQRRKNMHAWPHLPVQNASP